MSFKVRAMTVNDLTSIEGVQAEAYADHFLESRDVITQRFNSSPTTAWVAEREGKVCAYLVGYWSEARSVNPLNASFFIAENTNWFYLHDLALLTSVQGCGVGKVLIQTAKDHALQYAAEAIALLAVQGSKYFWMRFGFIECVELDIQQQLNLKTYCNEGADAFYMVNKL